jgi:hypothetical protein
MDARYRHKMPDMNFRPAPPPAATVCQVADRIGHLLADRVRQYDIHCRLADAMGNALAKKLLAQHRMRTKRVMAAPGAVSDPSGFDDGAMSERGVWTTDAVDRDGEVVVTTGADLSDFEINPVVFVDHRSPNHPWPIAKAAGPHGRCTAQVEAHRITGTIFYSQSDPQAVQFYYLAREGILRGYSIGFQPTVEPVPLPVTKHNPRPGYRFDKWKLLELSKVGLPSNPYAVTLTAPAAAQARSFLDKGRIADDPILPAVRKYLEAVAQPRRAAMAW